MSSKLTIKRIAELAGVSKATVSRVLNGYPHISDQVREQVQKVIDETGYQPNQVARSLASDRSNIIGLVIPSGPQAVFTDPYFSVLIESISQATNSNKLTLALFIFQTEEEGLDTVSGILSTGLLDGLIITADYKGELVTSKLASNSMPFVLIGRPNQPLGITSIDTDNVAGSYQATMYLIESGYKRVATIASNQNTSGEDRLTGYCKALEEVGLPFTEKLVAYGDYSLDSGYDAMKQLAPEKPDSVYIASDTMALGALRYLREINVQVPDDVAIVSHDDLAPALQADPQLTTIQQPIASTGIRAVEVLMELIAGDNIPARQIVLPNKLIVRASCGTVQLG